VPKQRINIAIDGYSGCGKSSTAIAVARKMGYTYIDTGSMYRAVTLYFLENNIPLDDEARINEVLSKIQLSFIINKGDTSFHILLNGRDVNQEIRSQRVSGLVSQVSTIPAVRRLMVAQQQEIGKNKGVVMDGRDIGTVVFPDAELKIFMTADPEVRAKRRVKELRERGINESESEIKQNLLSRDMIDSSRIHSPLRKAKGAIEIDTTHLTLEDQLNIVLNAALSIIH